MRLPGGQQRLCFELCSLGLGISCSMLLDSSLYMYIYNDNVYFDLYSLSGSIASFRSLESAVVAIPAYPPLHPPPQPCHHPAATTSSHPSESAVLLSPPFVPYVVSCCSQPRPQPCHLPRSNDYIQGVVAYFDIFFDACHKPLSFSTSPWRRPTHWKQTVFYLEDDITAYRGEVRN